MLLAPLALSSNDALLASQDAKEADAAYSIRGGAGGKGGDGAERVPLIAVTAKIGEGSSLDADVKLASFACNLMVEPIKVGVWYIHTVGEGATVVQ